jgi:hypothetical protein
MRRNIEPLSIGTTKTDISYQLSMMDLMKKLVYECRETNKILKETMLGDRQPRAP